jgi:hypothetical protein
MSRIDEARQAWSNAVERMEDLDIQLRGLDDNTEPEILAALEERFADSQRDAESKRRDYERAEVIAGVRSLQLPNETPDAQTGDETRHEHGLPSLKRSGPRVTVSKEENTYRPDNSNGNFYFRDLYYGKSGDRPRRSASSATSARSSSSVAISRPRTPPAATSCPRCTW